MAPYHSIECNLCEENYWKISMHIRLTKKWGSYPVAVGGAKTNSQRSFKLHAFFFENCFEIINRNKTVDSNCQYFKSMIYEHLWKCENLKIYQFRIEIITIENSVDIQIPVCRV